MPDEPPQNPSQRPDDGAWQRFLDALAAGLMWFTERRRWPLIAAAVLVVAAIGALIAYENLKRPADVHNESAAFNTNEAKVTEKTVNWPLYGYNLGRTRYLAAKGVKPPYKLLWHYSERPLLEFPPIYVDGRLYAADNAAHVYSLNARNGRVVWKRRIGTLNASSPTYSHKRLFVVNLQPGQVMALNPKNGKTEWRKVLPGRSESSPIVVDKRVFFGDEDGTLYAVDRRNGHTVWTTQLCGSIKAAPAYRHGILFVGDYGGCMSAVNSHSGKVKWQSSSQGLGLGSVGRFYSTPAVAFGRVYSGNLDHRVYSFEEKDGTLAWSHSTGSYVYSGPTVADTPQTPPSVYIGSYDGYVYALDARNGETRWQSPAGGPVISSPSAVGQIVYAGTYQGTKTVGLRMTNGHRVFHYGTGGGNSPAVSDGHRLFLIGYSSINALQPLTKKQIRGRAKNRRQREARRQKRRRARARARAEHRRKQAGPKQQGKQRSGSKGGKPKSGNAKGGKSKSG